MRIVVFTGRYPNQHNPYRHMFVHTRSMWYKEFGHDVLVLVPSVKHHTYEYQGIKVIEDNSKALLQHIASTDVVCFHLLLHRVNPKTDAGVIYNTILEQQIPTLFFIHGIETQKISRSHTDDISLSNPFSIAKLIYRDFYLIKRMRKTLFNYLHCHQKCLFIAPSQWMIEDCRETNDVDLNSKARVIPNGINTDRFCFTDRWEDRHKVMSIRPISGRAKYGVDLFIDMTKHLNPSFVANLFGDGDDDEFNKVVKYAETNGNSAILKINRQFIPNEAIPSFHQQHGIYAATTRMDAQGVSMCEAMASGLPVVSYDITAIGEFIQSDVNGFLANPYSISEYSNYVNELVEDRSLFERIAREGRLSMENIDIKLTVTRELDEAKNLG